jgi:hypothetical protein
LPAKEAIGPYVKMPAPHSDDHDPSRSARMIIQLHSNPARGNHGQDT